MAQSNSVSEFTNNNDTDPVDKSNSTYSNITGTDKYFPSDFDQPRFSVRSKQSEQITRNQKQGTTNTSGLPRSQTLAYLDTGKSQ